MFMLDYVRAQGHQEEAVNQHAPQSRQVLCPQLPLPTFKHHLLQFATALNPFAINTSYFVLVHFCLPKGMSSDSVELLQPSLNKLDLLLGASTCNTIAFPLKTNKNKAHLYEYYLKTVHFTSDKGHVSPCTGPLFKIQQIFIC